MGLVVAYALVAYALVAVGNPVLVLMVGGLSNPNAGLQNPGRQEGGPATNDSCPWHCPLAGVVLDDRGYGLGAGSGRHQPAVARGMWDRD